MFTNSSNIIKENYKIITSTQDRAKEIAINLTSPGWFLVTADEQTKGRGTHGRNWLSPANVNLYATFVIPFPTEKADLLINIPQVIAYSVILTLNKYGLEPKFKWINDILLNKKKVCGILCETETSLQLIGYNVVLAGIGINVNMDNIACNSLDQPATSLMLELGRTVDKNALLEALTENIVFSIGNLIQYGFNFFVQEISKKMEFLGEKIKIQQDDLEKTIKEGVLLGINEQGMLLLKNGNHIETLFIGRIIRTKEIDEKKPTVAIIGAGPSGLVSAKYALEYGLKPIVLEKNSDIGGIWQPTTGIVWDSMHTNLSHFSCMFTDLPWEELADDFPLQNKMYAYLHKYADKFSLKSYIQFNSHVIDIKEANGKWEVTWEEEIGRKAFHFDYVIVATGVFSSEFIPPIPNLENFKGKKIHSKDYKNPQQFENQTVAIIGSGFSGIEIAPDIASSAKKVYHSFRTPHWILPRNIPVNPVEQKSPKWPLDLLFYNNRSARKQKEEVKFKTAEDNRKSNAYMNSICQKQSEISNDLKIPEEKWSEPSQVSISDTYLDNVEKGKIILKKGSIKGFDSSNIIFEDNSRISVDSLVFCTGYKLNFSFLNDSVRNKLEFSPNDQLQPLILYKCTLHPEFRNLAFVGVYRGPYFAVMELQAKWANAIFSGKVDFPNELQFDTALEEERKIRQAFPRPQFPHGDYVGLADSIAEELKCLPDREELKRDDSKLYKQLYQGPVVPIGYRFAENGKLIEDKEKLSAFSKQLDEVSNFLKKRDEAELDSSYYKTKSQSTLLWGYNAKYMVGAAVLATSVGLYLAKRYKKI